MIQLAVNNESNVANLPRHNPHLIPGIARTFADKIEAGEFGQVDRVIVLLETDDAGILPLYWGDRITHVEALGLLHLGLAEATVRARSE